MTQEKRSALPHARMALADARLVVSEMRELGGDDPEWRIRARWISALAFLRLVGHVMDKVDQPALPARDAQVIISWWQGLKKPKQPEDSIFHDFIEEERNIIIKEYNFRFPWRHRILTVNNVPLTFNGRRLSFGGTFTIAEGPFEGQDALELCDRGLAWWEEKISMLESRLDHASRTARAAL